MEDKSIGDLNTVKGDIDKSIGNMPTVTGDSRNVIGRIDRYELVEQLGAGGFGSVYLAHDTVAKLDVAIKVLPPMISSIPEELENVRSNFALVTSLHHPNIATLLHLHKVASPDSAAQELLRVFADSYLVVMEYVPGSTLTSWRKQFDGGKVPFDKAVDIISKVAEGLDFAHGEKIIHRDIKPSNIMITPKDKVKILDFGLAAEIRSSMSRVSKEQYDTSGTRPYMAPEQWSGERQEAKTDQYSLACLLYELISGEVPFASVFETGDSLIMMNVVETKTPEPISQFTKKQNAVLLRALSKSPEDRFDSCKEFLNALRGQQIKRSNRINSSGGKSKKLLGVAVVIALVIITWLSIDKYSAYKKSETEKNRQEKIAVEICDRLEELKKEASSYESSNNLAEAGRCVSEILSLDSSNPFALKLQKRISERAGPTEAAPLKSRAEIAYDNLSTISSEQGFKSQIEKLKVDLKTAENLYIAKSYGSAMTAYQKVIAEVAVLLKLDKDRLKALSAKQRADSSKRAASSSNAENLASSIWKSANTICLDAVRKLNKSDFLGALKSFAASEKEFIHAKQYACGISSVNIVKRQYDRLLEGVKTSDLDNYGGSEWAEAKVLYFLLNRSNPKRPKLRITTFP